MCQLPKKKISHPQSTKTSILMLFLIHLAPRVGEKGKNIVDVVRHAHKLPASLFMFCNSLTCHFEVLKDTTRQL
jgi:hypothetical protein